MTTLKSKWNLGSKTRRFFYPAFSSTQLYYKKGTMATFTNILFSVSPSFIIVYPALYTVFSIISSSILSMCQYHLNIASHSLYNIYFPATSSAHFVMHNYIHNTHYKHSSHAVHIYTTYILLVTTALISLPNTSVGATLPSYILLLANIVSPFRLHISLSANLPFLLHSLLYL